jgi:hypothetical protein
METSSARTLRFACFSALLLAALASISSDPFAASGEDNEGKQCRVSEDPESCVIPTAPTYNHDINPPLDLDVLTPEEAHEAAMKVLGMRDAWDVRPVGGENTMKSLLGDQDLVDMLENFKLHYYTLGLRTRTFSRSGNLTRTFVPQARSITTSPTAHS